MKMTKHQYSQTHATETKYGNICGYTEEDIKEKFKEYLDDIDLKEMSKWYDGYWFLKDKLYNPFDILQYLQNKTLKNYWFTSGTLLFINKTVKRKEILPT